MTRIELPVPVIFDRWDLEHFYLNVDQYRARPEGVARDTDFVYIPKPRRGGSAYILSPRCATKHHRYVIALWS